MHLKPLPLALVGIVLILAMGAAWYLLARPTVSGPQGAATSTPSIAQKLQISEEGTYFEAEANYPSSAGLSASAGAEADQRAVTLMKTFAETQVASFKSENKLEGLTEEDAAMIPGLGVDRFYALKSDYEMRTSPVSISYVYMIYADTLGAHPNAYFRTFTFDRDTGVALEIADLFVPGTPFLKILSDKSRVSLSAQIAEASGVSEAELDRTMLDAGTTAVLTNFQTFYLDGSELVIVFPPYQVGPWAIGTQEVRIPRTELSSVLKAKYK